MSKEDYFKYYIQGSDHYLIPKDIFIELFDEMVNWREESQKQKEVIDKAIEYINKMFETGFYNDDYYLGHLNQILQDKEVK